MAVEIGRNRTFGGVRDLSRLGSWGKNAMLDIHVINKKGKTRKIVGFVEGYDPVSCRKLVGWVDPKFSDRPTLVRLALPCDLKVQPHIIG